MDISGVKVESIFKAEQVNPTLKIGGDESKKIAVAGDFKVFNIYVGTPSAANPDLIAQKVDNLISSPNPNQKTTDNNLLVATSPFLGIVKTPESVGTRINLEFAIINKYDTPVVIKGAYVKLDKGRVHFKKFFKINADSSREPDFTTRFPIIINSRGATTLAIEFENVEQTLISKGNLIGELFVLTGEDSVTSTKFELDVNESLVKLLEDFQKKAIDSKTAYLFDAMLKN